MDLGGFIKDHPIMLAIGVFVVGFIVLSSGNQGGGDGGAGAFYAAQAASKTSGDAVMIAQINANSSDKQALAYIDAQKSINTTWAGNQLATTQITANTAVSLAPYQVQSSYLEAVGNLAAQPSTVTTSTKKSGGIFGIGGSKKTTQTVTPNPGWALLDTFGDLFHAAH